MIKNITGSIFVLVLALLIASCGGATEAKVADKIKGKVSDEVKMEDLKISINASKSTVLWSGEMMGMYSHKGTVDMKSGEVILKNGNLSSGNFVVDLASMKATDANFMPEDGKTPEKLIGHLSSPDFFDVASFPTAKFVIESVSGNKAKGKLTVRGKTNTEVVENISIKSDGSMYKMSGTLTFDRKKYGVAFDHPVKEMILSNDITLDVFIVAGK